MNQQSALNTTGFSRRPSGTPQVLLTHHLKQLKLPTILREYDKIARECAGDGFDHPRYLLRLVELEMIDRKRRMVERRTNLIIPIGQKTALGGRLSAITQFRP